MAKKTVEESDEARLKKRVRERLAGSENPEADASLRALRKRLKRAQRRRRKLALRKQHAMKKQKTAAPAQA
ncbi:hypothetical protein [Nitrospira sp. Kam-Ns4a]